jgi:GntR family galactonate operon transcriptional repressor
MLEIEAAGLAAERATAVDLMRMAQALAAMSACAARAPASEAAEELYHEADVGFHAGVLAAAGNRVLTRVTEPVRHALAAARRPLAHQERRAERAFPEHKRILAAIARRDADEARAAMRDHLATLDAYLRKYEAARKTRA